MAAKVGELYQSLKLDDSKFNKGMKSAKKKSSGLSSMLGGIGTAAAAGAATAGAALAGAAAKGVKEFGKFDKQMNEVFTLMPKASEEAQKQMSSDLRAFSNEMGVATDEAAPALYQAISAGVPKDNVFNFMEEAQKAATAGVTDLKTSVDVLSSVVNTYGEENISAAEASDLMFTAVKQGKTTFGELSANMSDVAPIASSMGIEFNNVTAALSTMTSQGTPTAKATTQLKSAMSELSKEGSKAGTAFADVAGTDFQTFISEGGNLQEAMALMEEAAKENGTTVSNMFGSIEAGQAALALTGEGAKKFKEDLNEMNNSSGATETAYKKMEESLTRNMERIQVGMNEVWLTVGEQLMPIMKDMTDWIIANMPKIQDTAETVFSAISDAIYWGIDAYKEIKSFVSGFVSDNSESLNAVKSDYQEIFDSIKQIVTIFVGWAQDFWSAYGENITKAAKATWTSVKQIFNMQLDNIRDLFQGIVKLMQGDFEGFGEELGNIGSRMFVLLADVFERQWKNVIKPAITEMADKIIQGFQELPEKMKEAGEDIVKGIKKGITNKADEAVNAVKGVAGGIKDKFTGLLGIKSPSKVFMGYGLNIAEGLGLGIENNSDQAVSGLETLWDNMQKAEVFETKWEDKLFGETATAEEKLAKQKKIALQYAKEIGAETAAVRKYFALKEEEIRKQKMEKELERKNILKKADMNLWNQMKANIGNYVSDFREKMLTSNEAVKSFSKAAADTMVGFFDMMTTGAKSFKESMIDAVLTIITALEKQVIAEQAAGVATAWAQAPATFGASLGYIGKIVSESAAAIATFEGIKGALRSFHQGGTIPGPIGQEVPILAKAGETVSPIGSNTGSSGGGYNTANISVNLDGRTIAQASKQHLVDSIRITGGARF